MEKHPPCTSPEVIEDSEGEIASEKTMRESSIPESVSLIPTSPNTNSSQHESHTEAKPKNNSRGAPACSDSQPRFVRLGSSRGRVEVALPAPKDTSLTESSECDDSGDETFQEARKSTARGRGRPRGTKEKKAGTNHKDPAPTKRGRDDEGADNPKATKRSRKSANVEEVKLPSNVISLEDSRKFQLDLNSLGERYAAKDKALEAAKAEIQRLQEQVSIHESTIERQKEKHERKEAKLNVSVNAWSEKYRALEKKYDDLRVNTLEILEARIPDHGGYIKVSDDTIVGKWKQMSYNIYMIVTQFLTTHPVDASKIPQRAANDADLVKLAESCNSTPGIRKLLLENYLWRRIHWVIFMGRGALWAGDTGKQLTQVILNMQDRGINDPKYLSAISRMKSIIVQDVDRLLGIDKEAVNRLIHSIRTDLLIFTPSSQTNEFLSAISEALHQAVELHAIMLGSKAIFLVGRRIVTEKQNGYDPERMEPFNYLDYDEPKSDWVVDRILTPALEKVGNADGENFTSQMVLCKAKVMLDRLVG